MTRQEILDGYVEAHYPGLRGYAYQGTTWCEDCGRIIGRRLVREMTREQLKSITHDDLCDTAQFPMPTREPIDYCDHCGAIED